jgi:hypothetical protein
MESVGYGRPKKMKGKGIVDNIKDHVQSKKWVSGTLKEIANNLPYTKYSALTPIVSKAAKWVSEKGWGMKKPRRRRVKKVMMGGAMGDGVNRMYTLQSSLRANRG